MLFNSLLAWLVFKSHSKFILTLKKRPIDTPLTTTDEETRLVILTTRLTSILENKINYKSDSALEIKSKKAPFVKTKFVSSRNYLWERCSYFEETEEVFYVKLFLDSGKFLIGHQLFIDKTNEVWIFISFKFFWFY